jgi:ferredoxin
MLKIIYKEKIINYNDSNKTILETLENVGIKPFSMCKEGYCLTCRMHLVEGEVNYIEEPLGYLEQGEILPCISKPVTDIKIDYK